MPMPLKKIIQAIEKHVITDAMSAAGDNCARAAKSLGMKRTSLIEKRRRYKLPLRTQPKTSHTVKKLCEAIQFLGCSIEETARFASGGLVDFSDLKAELRRARAVVRKAER